MPINEIQLPGLYRVCLQVDQTTWYPQLQPGMLLQVIGRRRARSCARARPAAETDPALFVHLLSVSHDRTHTRSRRCVVHQQHSAHRRTIGHDANVHCQRINRRPGRTHSSDGAHRHGIRQLQRRRRHRGARRRADICGRHCRQHLFMTAVCTLSASAHSEIGLGWPPPFHHCD